MPVHFGTYPKLEGSTCRIFGLENRRNLPGIPDHTSKPRILYRDYSASVSRWTPLANDTYVDWKPSNFPTKKGTENAIPFEESDGKILFLWSLSRVRK